MSEKNILKEILKPYWYEKLSSTILNNKDYDYFFNDKDRFFPNLENVFNAVNNIDLENKTKVVVFGQDPYPRKESATGYAFWDGKIKSWNDRLSPSFKNLFKSILISYGLAEKKDNIAKLRKTISDKAIFSPDDFFEKSIKNNIIWLNASFSFEGKAQSLLNKHLKFWKPVVKEIIKVLLESSDDVIFVFWGKKSLKFQKFIIDTGYKNYHFVENGHPMLENFHNKNSFNDINEILEKINKNKIDWLNI